MSSALGSLIGQSIDRYEIEAQLGQGGFGVVYLARHKVLGTKVALKVLWPDHADDPKNVERFLREARAAASVGSQHIARLFDAGITDEHVFLAMEVLDGHDLDEELEERGPLPIDEAVHIALEVLEALARAHEVKIVHRDLKPANVFLAKNREGGITVKLLDFGISKVVGQKSLTAAGAIVGTPQYMAPEQIDGQKLDGRADLYAVGILLYQMFTNTVPFDGTGYEVLIERMRGRVPQPLAEVAPHVPGPIGAVVDCALRTAREIRWRTADEMRDALRAALAGEWPDLSAITAEDQALPPIPVTIPPSSLPGDMAARVLAANTIAERASVSPVDAAAYASTAPGGHPAPKKTELLPSEPPPASRRAAGAPDNRRAAGGPNNRRAAGAPNNPRAVRTELLPSEPPMPAPAGVRPLSGHPPPAQRPLRTELLPSEPPPSFAAPTPVRMEIAASGAMPSPSVPSAAGRPMSAASWVSTPADVRAPIARSPARTVAWIAIAGLALMGALGIGVLFVLLFRLASRSETEPESPRIEEPSVEPAVIAPPEINRGPLDPVPMDPTPSIDRRSNDPSLVRYQVVQHVGMGSRAAMDAVFERARSDVAACGGPTPMRVAVQLIATLEGRISIAQASSLRNSDDAVVARCVANAIAAHGPAAFGPDESAIVELDVELPGR